MSNLRQSDNKVTLMLIWMLVTFAFKAVNASIFHSGLDMYHFFCFVIVELSFAVWHYKVSAESQLFLTSIKELFKCAGATNAEILDMGFCSFSNCVFVDVGCNLLNHFDLFSSSI